jgi:hypothetical protein
MVQQIGGILVFNVYLLPESSNWAGDLECDPCLALASSVAVAYAGRFQILIMGDLNSRTKSQTASVYDPPRRSMDDKPVSTRGRFLFKLCADYNLMILNGIERFGPNSGAFTSFQGARKTDIDYVICSKSLYPKITAFNVLPREPQFDHAAITVQLKIEPTLLSTAVPIPTRKRKREDVVLPDKTELGKLLIQTLDAGKDSSKKTLELFGPVYFDTDPIVVTICGVAKNAGKHTDTAGSSAFFRLGSRLNRSLRVWGIPPTNACADLIALLAAIEAAPRTKLSVSLRDPSTL